MNPDPSMLALLLQNPEIMAQLQAQAPQPGAPNAQQQNMFTLGAMDGAAGTGMMPGPVGGPGAPPPGMGMGGPMGAQPPMMPSPLGMRGNY